jgi:hypothetical protein
LWRSDRRAGCVINVPEKDLGERQVQHNLACFILDLNGMVPWILASGSEHTDEILGGAQRFPTSSLCTGEVKAKFIIASTVAFAADVKEVTLHKATRLCPNNQTFFGYCQGFAIT